MPAAARIGDMHICPFVEGIKPHVGGPITGMGSVNVYIEGKAAATVGDICICVGSVDSIVRGSRSVFINGKPAARMFDPTVHGGMITQGSMMVIIGG